MIDQVGQNEVVVHDKTFVPYISPEEIDKRVKELGAAIVRDCGDKQPLFIVVLNGAFMFASDLIKEVPIDCQVTFTASLLSRADIYWCCSRSGSHRY